MKPADLMTEASYMKQKELQELTVAKLKINMKIGRAKTRSKITEGEEKKFGGMTKQEDLGYKFFEKLPFPQSNFNYLYENSGRCLGAPAMLQFLRKFITKVFLFCRLYR